MFDLSSGKLILIGVIALVVVGPKELPGLLRQVGRAVAKMREMAGEFRQQFDEAMREADLHEVTKLVDEVKGNVTSNIQNALDPVTDIPNQIGDSMDLAEIGATGSTSLGAADSAVSLDLPLPEEPPPLAITAEAGPAKPKRRSRRKEAAAEEPASTEPAPTEPAPAEPAPAIAADEPSEKPVPRTRRRKAAVEAAPEQTVPETTAADEPVPAPKKSRKKKSAPAEDEDA